MQTKTANVINRVQHTNECAKIKRRIAKRCMIFGSMMKSEKKKYRTCTFENYSRKRTPLVDKNK